MNPSPFRRSALRLTLALSLVTSIWSAGCSDSDPGQLEVAVSTGYPILGATVTLKGSNGATVELTDTANTGSVVFTRKGLVATLGAGPYLVRSTGGKANGEAVTEQYYSIANAAEGRTNVTPITHMIAVEATGTVNSNGIKNLFAAGFDASKAQQLSQTKLAAAKTSVSYVLKNVNPRINIDTYDPLSASFSFGDAIDSHLDYLTLALRANNKSINDVQTLVAKKTADQAITAELDGFKPIKRVIAFGDSLTDGGTYTIWASGAASGANRFIGTPFVALEAASLWGGKFTTNPGKVWVEHLAATYDYPIKPALLMGGQQPMLNLSQLGCTTCTNYAQGGARIADQPGIGNQGTSAGQNDYNRANAFNAASTLPVREQITIHLAANGKFAAGDLVLVLAGANDIFVQAQAAASPQAAQAAVQAAATSLIGEAVRLRDANATALVVIGLPDMGNTPSGVASGQAAALTGLSTQLFNAVVSQGLKAQGIAFLDPNPVLSAIMANPAKYGIKTTIDKTDSTKARESVACGANAIAQKLAGDNPLEPSSLYCSVPNTAAGNNGTLRVPGADSTYLFADGVHPSSQAHKILADHLGVELPRLLMRNAL